MKSIWLSAMKKDETAVQKIMAQFKTYGLEAQGHFWENDNAKLAWLGARESLLSLRNGMWVILGGREELENGDLRYGLSMTALSLQSRQGAGYPIVILQSAGERISSEELPTPLSNAVVLDANDPGTPAKLVAKVHAKAMDLPAAYYVDMVGNEQLGQWLEVRPAGTSWPGVIFGVDEGEIVFQALGPAGQLPKKTTLNYAMQGLKLEMGGTEFVAWAARNEVSGDNAYFVKINGTPKTLVFGPYVEDAEAELYIVRLQ